MPMKTVKHFSSTEQTAVESVYEAGTKSLKSQLRSDLFKSNINKFQVKVSGECVCFSVKNTHFNSRFALKANTVNSQ